MFEIEKAPAAERKNSIDKTKKDQRSETRICPICYADGHGAGGCEIIENLGVNAGKDKVFAKIKALISENGIAKLEEEGVQMILNQADEKERQEVIEKIISFYGLGSEWTDKIKYRKNGKGNDGGSNTEAIKVKVLKDPQSRLLEGNNGKVKIRINELPIFLDRDTGKYMFRYNLVKDGDEKDEAVRIDPLSALMYLKKDEEAEINRLRGTAQKIFSKRAA